MLQAQQQRTRSFFALLSLPATAMGFALSVQISALSWLLSTQFGLDIHEVGLVWAAGPLAGILGQVLVGFISDGVWFWGGRRRPFILIGGVLAALMLLALPSIGVISEAMGAGAILGVAITVALTLDLAINISFNPTRSIIADVTPEGIDRTRGYTWMQTISGSFGVLAYAVGALFGNMMLIYSGAILVLLFSIIPPFFIEEPRSLQTSDTPEPVSQSSVSKSSFKEIMLSLTPLWGFAIYAVYGMTKSLLKLNIEHHYVELGLIALTAILMFRVFSRSEAGVSTSEAGAIGFQKIMAAHSFSWVGVQTMFIYLYAYIENKNPQMTDTEMGQVVSIAFLVLNAVGAILPAFILEPLTRRWGRVRVHALSLMMMTAGYVGIWLMGAQPWVIYAMMAVCGIGWAAIVSLPFAVMSQKVDHTKMGLYMGLFNLSVVLPQLVASLGIGEVISAAADKDILFAICAGTMLLSSLSWFWVKE
jgi:maltose/moltooligosaccharide transporter